MKIGTGAAGAVNVPAISAWNADGLMVTDTGESGESAKAAAAWAATAVGPCAAITPGCAAETGCIPTALSARDVSIDAACDAASSAVARSTAGSWLRESS